jgi:hypothetical protein
MLSLRRAAGRGRLDSQRLSPLRYLTWLVESLGRILPPGGWRRPTGAASNVINNSEQHQDHGQSEEQPIDDTERSEHGRIIRERGPLEQEILAAGNSGRAAMLAFRLTPRRWKGGNNATAAGRSTAAETAAKIPDERANECCRPCSRHTDDKCNPDFKRPQVVRCWIL